MSGLTMMQRDSAGGLVLAAYHPRNCPTWHWSLRLYQTEGRNGYFDLRQRKGSGERGLHLFGWTLSLNQQDYHKAHP